MAGVSRKPAVLAAACIAAAAVLVFLYVGRARWRDTMSPEEAVALRPLPHFALKDYNGEEVTEKDFSGRLTLIYIWASWCPLCVQGLADLAEIKREFGDAVAAVAINRAESLETARGLSAPEGGMATGTVFLLDPHDAYYGALGGFAMPETIFADRAGIIRSYKRGPQSREEMRHRIRGLME